MTTGTAATVPVIRGMLDEAARKRYTGGVLGVRARPEWDGPDEFVHNGVAVRVVACPSALAVREALRERSPDRWLVVLTDRDSAELGRGITAHLIWHRLRPPDPWRAVQDQFGAARLDHRLITGPAARELATGLLAAAPPQGWPPAPGGLLTADHALGAVAAARLGLGRPGAPLDLITTLRWSAGGHAATAVADLRALAGDPLVDRLLGWVADRSGSCGPAVGTLLRDGRAGDVVPLGLVARAVIAAGPGSGPRALLGREIGGQLGEHVLTVWASDAEAVTRDLTAGDPDGAARVLARAESLLDALEAGSFAAESDVLRRGLTSRLAALGDALRAVTDRAAARATAAGPDAPLADLRSLPRMEELRTRVESHALAGHRDEVRVPRALAAVRLARWLAGPALPGGPLAVLVARHRDEDSWVDRAIAQAWTGVEDEALARGMRAVLSAARLRRDAHDLAFGQALGGNLRRDAPAPAGSHHLEDLLTATVIPLARRRPVLLVVADGMSQGIASAIVDDVVRRYETWLECLPEGHDRRLTALAALPSVTAVCRASLLSGELTVGDRATERAGLETLAKSHGLTATLFHKLSLDSSAGGHALAQEVRAAVDDVSGVALVACVLNAIDDALDRSDPGGTTWTSDTVRHLRPLLERARRAGRIVVLTSDHGHVVERREGILRPAPTTSSNRSRPYGGGPPVGDGEILVSGRRVLLHGEAVLAVDERLRYGPLKAGYHGGAAPAEVVVPVCVLASGDAPPGWRLAPPQSPAWWRGPAIEPAGPAAAAPPAAEPPTLFDLAPPADGPVTGSPAAVAAAVLASPAYRAQRRRAARAAITDQQVSRLLSALLSAPGHRLDPESAAAALDIAAVQLTGALSQAQRLLNIEQYPVLRRDSDGTTVILDKAMLLEQFEVNR